MTTMNLYSESYIPPLSAAEKQTYTYILQHEEARGMSIRQLADAVNVSTATVIRMVRKFGYHGYSGFREAVYESDHSLSDTDSYILLSTFFESTSRTVSFLSAVSKAADYLNRSRTIVFLGDSFSFAACQYGIAQMRKTGRKACMYSNSDLPADACAVMISSRDFIPAEIKQLHIPIILISCAGCTYEQAAVQIICFEQTDCRVDSLIPAVHVLEELRKRMTDR